MPTFSQIQQAWNNLVLGPVPLTQPLQGPAGGITITPSGAAQWTSTGEPVTLQSADWTGASVDVNPMDDLEWSDPPPGEEPGIIPLTAFEPTQAEAPPSPWSQSTVTFGASIPASVLPAETITLSPSGYANWYGRKSKKPPKNYDPNKDLWWKKWAVDVLHTGSRVICDPPPKDTDDDWLILVAPESIVSLEKKLFEEGFRRGGSGGPGLRADTNLSEYPKPVRHSGESKDEFFHSWKKDDLNVIVTLSPEFFSNFSKATDLSCYLNLYSKQDRIRMFDAIVYDLWP